MAGRGRGMRHPPGTRVPLSSEPLTLCVTQPRVTRPCVMQPCFARQRRMRPRFMRPCAVRYGVRAQRSSRMQGGIVPLCGAAPHDSSRQRSSRQKCSARRWQDQLGTHVHIRGTSAVQHSAWYTVPALKRPIWTVALSPACGSAPAGVASARRRLVLALRLTDGGRVSAASSARNLALVS
jgi:hypothetical protein